MPAVCVCESVEGDMGVDSMKSLRIFCAQRSHSLYAS
jgi:hypothetical protein